MKTCLKTILFVCFVATIGLLSNSCSEEKGDYMYYLTVSDDTSTGSYNSYIYSGAQSTIITEVKKVATEVSTTSYTYQISGKKKDCENAIKAAVDAGMDAVESSSSYGSLFDLSETTVVIKCINDNNSTIYSRKFKSIN